MQVALGPEVVAGFLLDESGDVPDRRDDRLRIKGHARILSTTIQTIRLIGTRKKKIASPSSSDAARLRRHRRRSLKNHI